MIIVYLLTRMTTSNPPSSQPPVVYPPIYTTTVIQVVEPDSGICPYCGRHTGHITVNEVPEKKQSE